jgi:hypothetical protein
MSAGLKWIQKKMQLYSSKHKEIICGGGVATQRHYLWQWCCYTKTLSVAVVLLYKDIICGGGVATQKGKHMFALHMP